MENIKRNNSLQAASISDILAQGEKPSLSGLLSCADALQYLQKNQIFTALVQNSHGHFVGVVTHKTLQTLDKQAQTAAVEAALEGMADVCTPMCNAHDVYQRLQQSQAPCVLVVNPSGQLLSFLEPCDFTKRMQP